MTTPLSLAIRQARLLAVRDAVVALWFYPGAIATIPEETTAQTRLALLTLDSPGGSIGADGYVATLTLTVPRITLANQSALCSWVRFVDASGNSIMDLPTTDTTDPLPEGKVVLSDTRVYVGGELQLISCVIRE
jgi:hypothetical protein